MKSIKLLWKTKPLMPIIFIALLVRLVAVVFSQGYGMYDDHYCVIEVAQSWVDGGDFDNWLPANSNEEIKSSGRSLLYPGLHYVLFEVFEFFGLFNPKIKMLLIRLLHALFSLIIVSSGYKITRKLTNTETAKQVGIFLALLWCMPFLSVRNLVEIVCIPFLMLGILKIVQVNPKQKVLLQYLIAGLIMGVAFSIRFQTALFIGGTGLAILIQKKWKEAIGFGIGALLSMIIIQSVIDFFVWGMPFTEFMGYFRHNVANRYAYTVGSWEKYILVLIGIFFVPLGLFFLFGFFKTWKKYTILFLPTFIFLAFHSYFPNKQERFIFPIVPFFLILGFIGWKQFTEKSKFWIKRTKLLRICYIIFWVLNFAALSFLTVSYSKKARVESIAYLAKYENANTILIEDTNFGTNFVPPSFYLKHRVMAYVLGNKIDDTKYTEVNQWQKYMKTIFTPKYFETLSREELPEFVLFIGEKNIEQRAKTMKLTFPKLEKEIIIDTGIMDKLVHWLNPINKNQKIIIYKTNI